MYIMRWIINKKKYLHLIGFYYQAHMKIVTSSIKKNMFLIMVQVIEKIVEFIFFDIMFKFADCLR